MILNNEKQSKQEIIIDDAVADVMHMQPDLFMASAVVELRQLPMASKRRRARELASDCKLFETLARASNDRFASKQWGQFAWDLRTLK